MSNKKITAEELAEECRMLKEQNKKLQSINHKLQREVFELKYRGLPLWIKRKIESFNNDGKTTLWAIINNFINTKP